MTEAEKALKLKERIYPRRLFPEKYQDEQTQPTPAPTQTKDNSS